MLWAWGTAWGWAKTSCKVQITSVILISSNEQQGPLSDHFKSELMVVDVMREMS